MDINKTKKIDVYKTVLFPNKKYIIATLTKIWNSNETAQYIPSQLGSTASVKLRKKVK